MVLLIVGLLAYMGYLYMQLKQAQLDNKELKHHMDYLIQLRDAALDITNRVLNANNMDDSLQYILERCMALIPKSKFGSILMFNQDNLLVARASVGFIEEEINQFTLPLNESFLYIASDGKVDQTMIINRLEDIVLEENIVKSEGQEWAIRSEVSAPLYIDGDLIGLLCIDGDKNDIFTEKDIHILDYMARQISEVIDKQQLYEEILYLSRYDKQTHLLNRNGFDTETGHFIEKAHKMEDELALVIMDLDDLKWVNDTFGHVTGDQLIEAFAKGLKESLNEQDQGSRYGGDEFLCLINHQSPEAIKAMLDTLQFQLQSNPLKIGAATIFPEFSYGIASLKETSPYFDELYKLADQRMYAQKRQKKAQKNKMPVSKMMNG